MQVHPVGNAGGIKEIVFSLIRVKPRGSLFVTSTCYCRWRITSWKFGLGMMYRPGWPATAMRLMTSLLIFYLLSYSVGVCENTAARGCRVGARRDEANSINESVRGVIQALLAEVAGGEHLVYDKVLD